MTSHSSTSRFNTCPWAYHLSSQDIHKTAVGPESNYLVWGKAMHAALECHYNRRCDPVHAFCQAYPNDLNPGDTVWTREGGVRTVEAYIGYYQQIDQQWDILDVELKDNPDKPTLVIDLVARHKQSGSVYGWDHKFKAKISRDSGRRYEMDGQISRYTLFLMEKYGDCAGFVMNIVVPGYRQNKWRDQPAGWHWKFDRMIVQRTPQQLEYWQRSQSEWELMIAHCEATGSYPKHLGWNCTMCEYMEYCYSGGDDEILQNLYAIGEQKPFEVVFEDE